MVRRVGAWLLHEPFSSNIGTALFLAVRANIIQMIVVKKCEPMSVVRQMLSVLADSTFSNLIHCRTPQFMCKLTSWIGVNSSKYTSC